MSTDTTRGNPATGKRIKTLAVCAMAALSSLAVAVPAPAMPVGDGVRAGKNVSVFGSLDFVAAYGYPAGQRLTIDVYRGDTRIATGFGRAVDTAEGGGLEVNHGVEGNTVQGDCWENFTPDVRPGDRVVVTDSSGATDEVLVDNITISGPPQLDASTDDPNDIIVEGAASYANGERIPTNSLDSGEVRLGSTFRATPDEVVEVGADGWKAVYRQDARGQYNWFKNRGLSSEEQKQAILDGDHAMGYGHVAPLPPETQMVEGLGAGGPAPGCEALAPDAPASAMGVTSPELISQANANGSVSVGGVIQDGVDVALQLNGADLPAAGVDRANGTWSTRAPAADFREGDNEVKATFTGPGAPAQPQTANVEKDTTPPAAATATPKPGLYNADQSVTLGVSEPRTTVRYTTDGTDPGATTGTLYDGRQIPVTSDTTIKTVTIDAVGNAGDVTAFEYRVDKALPGLSASLDAGTYDAAQTLGLSSDDADVVDIRYTTNGDTPTKSTGTSYSGPIEIARTQTVKAVAVDAAGNTSPVLGRGFLIRTATKTNLNVSSADLKRGRSRAVGGSVSPNQARGLVRVTVDRPGALPNAQRSFALDDFSRFGFAYKPNASGIHRIKATFVKDADALGSTSVVKSFRVIR